MRSSEVVFSSTAVHRQGAGPAITAETICPAGQSVGLIRGPSHNKSDRLSKCKHMSFYAICLHATSALDSITTNNL